MKSAKFLFVIFLLCGAHIQAMFSTAEERLCRFERLFGRCWRGQWDALHDLRHRLTCYGSTQGLDSIVAKNLKRAIKEDNVAMVRLIAEAYRDVGSLEMVPGWYGGYGVSPLLYACEQSRWVKHTNAVRVLLENGGCVSSGSLWDPSPLDFLLEGGYEDTAELLMKHNVRTGRFYRQKKPTQLLLRALKKGLPRVAAYAVNYSTYRDQYDRVVPDVSTDLDAETENGPRVLAMAAEQSSTHAEREQRKKFVEVTRALLWRGAAMKDEPLDTPW